MWETKTNKPDHKLHFLARNGLGGIDLSIIPSLRVFVPGLPRYPPAPATQQFQQFPRRWFCEQLACDAGSSGSQICTKFCRGSCAAQVWGCLLVGHRPSWPQMTLRNSLWMPCLRRFVHDVDTNNVLTLHIFAFFKILFIQCCLVSLMCCSSTALLPQVKHFSQTHPWRSESAWLRQCEAWSFHKWMEKATDCK